MDRRIAMALIQKAFDDEEKKENQEMPCRDPIGEPYFIETDEGKKLYKKYFKHGDKTMPCRSGPISDDYIDPKNVATVERKRIANQTAARLHRWLDDKLGNQDLDEAGRLCATLRGLGNQEFWNLIAKNIEDPTARELLGWWEEHQHIDAMRDQYGTKG